MFLAQMQIDFIYYILSFLFSLLEIWFVFDHKLIVNKGKEKKKNNQIEFNPLLGMVAQCAGCNNYPVWAALIIGGMGGAVFHGVHW